VLFEDIRVKVYYPKISFRCNPELKCGICCKIAPADLSEDEYLRLVDAGYRRFAYKVGYGVYQIIRKGEGCIFLEGYKCKIYDLRPASCRAFPFVPAFFDFHERVLVSLFDPKAFEFCKGIGDGEMDLDVVYDCALACRKIFADRVKILADFRDLHEAFLLVALSTPKKIGMITGSPWRTQCYCCGYPLVISEHYKIYKDMLKRDFKDFGDYLVCEKCLNNDPEETRKKLLFNPELRKIVEEFIRF